MLGFDPGKSPPEPFLLVQMALKAGRGFVPWLSSGAVQTETDMARFAPLASCSAMFHLLKGGLSRLGGFPFRLSVANLLDLKMSRLNPVTGLCKQNVRMMDTRLLVW